MIRAQNHADLFGAVQEDTTCGEIVQPSLGVLESASDFEIHGGNISSIGGDSTSFTAKRDVHVIINHHHPPSPTPSISLSSSSSSASSPKGQCICQHRYPEEIYSPPRSTRRLSTERNCDIFRCHLATKGRGLPLWIPGPSQTLPIRYQIQGISMGDVGVATVAGGFLYLFNIFEPENHPINPHTMPEGFKPFKRKRGSHTSPSERDLMRNGYLASPSNIRARRDRGTASLVFESFECDGAILTMPVGAKTEDLPCLVRLRKYVTANLTSWYRYARLYLGMDIQNGDLKVVTGCDKTSAWGMACLGGGLDSSSSSISSGSGENRRFYLEFGPTDNNDSSLQGGRYDWAYSGEVAEVRAGPDSSEVAKLRLAVARCRGEDEKYQVEEDGAEHYENQCLFLRTMNPMLPEKVWLEILEGERDSDSESEDDNSEEFNEKSDLVRRNDHSSSSSPRNANQNDLSSRSPGGTPGVPGTELLSLDTSYMPSDFPSRLASLLDHPSIAINNFLLGHCSEKTMIAVSLDQDWISVLREDDVTLPSSEELLARLLETCSVREEDGVVFFDSEYQHDDGIAGGDTTVLDQAVQQIKQKMDEPTTHAIADGFRNPNQGRQWQGRNSISSGSVQQWIAGPSFDGISLVVPGRVAQQTKQQIRAGSDHLNFMLPRSKSQATPFIPSATIETAQPVASTSTVKRLREEDSSVAGTSGGGLAFVSSASQVMDEAPPPKRVKTDWEAPPSEALRNQAEAHMKTEYDATEFFEQVPDFIEQDFNGFFDFSLYEDSRTKTPDLISSSSANPSPQLDSDLLFDVEKEGVSDATRHDISKDIDRGEGVVYCPTSEWNPDSMMRSFDPTWATYSP